MTIAQFFAWTSYIAVAAAVLIVVDRCRRKAYVQRKQIAQLQKELAACQKERDKANKIVEFIDRNIGKLT